MIVLRFRNEPPSIHWLRVVAGLWHWYGEEKKLQDVQGASREKDVLKMDVTEQVEGVEAWVGGS